MDKERQPHFSMIRGFHLADWFTIANAFCGMGAVLAVMAYLQGELASGCQFLLSQKSFMSPRCGTLWSTQSAVRPQPQAQPSAPL